MPSGTTPWVYGLVCEDIWEGTIASVVPYMPLNPGGWTTFLIMNGAPDFSNQLLLARRHCIEVLDGPWQGLVLDVMEGAGSEVTVWADCGPAGFNLSPGTSVALRRHATLGTMFPPATCGFEPYTDVIVLSVMVPDSNGNGLELAERVYGTDGEHWSDLIDGSIADNVVAYPGQGFLALIGSNPGDPPRMVTFGAGEVCHVKPGPTLVPVYGGQTAWEWQGPVWPVEATTSGGLATVSLLSIGLQDVLDPWNDIASIYNLDGQFQTSLICYSDGAGNLWDAVSFLQLTEARRFTKGSAVSMSALAPRYWKVPGLLPLGGSP